MKRTYFGVEEKAIVIADVATSNMVEIQLKLVKNPGNKQQTIDLLSLNEFDSDFIVNDANINLSILRFSLKPRAS